jgi:hypothetical protein
MEFVTLEPEHVMSLKDFVDVHSGYEVDEPMAKEIANIGGYAAIGNEGEVIGVGGVMPQLWGGGLAWAWLSRKWRKYARETTEGINKILDESEYERIEAGVLVDFKAGHSWAERLGFFLETPVAHKWGPDFKDYSIYVRLK